MVHCRLKNVDITEESTVFIYVPQFHKFLLLILEALKDHFTKLSGTDFCCTVTVTKSWLVLARKTLPTVSSKSAFPIQ